MFTPYLPRETTFYLFVCLPGRYEGNTLLTGQHTQNCLSIGAPKTTNFPFAQNGKLKFSGDPIFKDIMIFSLLKVDPIKEY